MNMKMIHIFDAIVFYFNHIVIKRRLVDCGRISKMSANYTQACSRCVRRTEHRVRIAFICTQQPRLVYFTQFDLSKFGTIHTKRTNYES